MIWGQRSVKGHGSKDQDQKNTNIRDFQNLIPRGLNLVLTIPILKSKLQCPTH